MPDFGIMRGFNEKLFGDKLVAGQLPTQLGLIGSTAFGFVGILDDYPNAAAAYSLRGLKIAYTGNAIRVRRSSDNAEQDIGFIDNTNKDLDIAALTSFCSGTNGFVTTWYDQSGNGRNATQTTAANQPQIVSSGNIINENSKPCLDWDGTNRWLQTAVFSPTISQPLTYFITAQIDSIANNSLLDGISNGNGLFYRSSTSNMNYIFGATLTDSAMPNSQLLFSIIANTTSSEIYNNAVLQVSGNIGNAALDGLIIGNLGSGFTAFNFQLRGSYQELIVYPSNQSTNRGAIESNINTYYAIY
jgi:hypothetical protein